MDAERFDALSRSLAHSAPRRRVLTGLASTLGVFLPLALRATVTDAKKKRCPPCKRRKKGKCKGALPDGTRCPGGSCQGGSCRADSCPGQKPCEGECIPTDQCCTRDDCPTAEDLCCDGECSDEFVGTRGICSSHLACCSNYCQLDALSGQSCAATCRGKPCDLDRDCCRGFPCLPVEVDGSEGRTCGGCQDTGLLCDSDADCCFSACTQLLGLSNKRCASFPGGPCAKGLDCWSCLGDLDCTVTIDGASRDICENGVCGCPEVWECCSNFDCPLDKTCVFVFQGLDLTGECRTVLPG